MAKRRGRGDGAIVELPDGRWQGRIDLGWENGRRRRKAFYGRTRADVRAKLTKAQRDVENGQSLGDERQTVEQFLTRWLQDVAQARVRPRTFEGYEAAISHHVSPYLGKRPLARLTPQHVQAWLGTLDTAGVSVGRRRYARVVLRAALNTALRWRLVVQNAAMLVDAPRAVAREIRPLTPDEARQLLKATDGHALQGFVAVALGCGLRLGEALGLTWQDVDLEGASLRVRQALQQSGGNTAKRRPLLTERRRLTAALKTEKDRPRRATLQQELAGVRKKVRALKTSVQLVEPKSARSRRTIALPAVTVSALRAHRKRQLEARLAAGAAWQDLGFVFTTPIGTPADPHNLHKQFKALLASAKLPAVRIHDLRHSCATLLLAQGVDPRTIMETLGHSQISLTLNTYTHVLPTLQREAATKLDLILKG